MDIFANSYAWLGKEGILTLTNIFLTLINTVIGFWVLIVALRTYKAEQDYRQAENAQKDIFFDCLGTYIGQYQEKTVLLTEYTIRSQIPYETVVCFLGTYLKAEKLTFRAIFSGTLFSEFKIFPPLDGHDIIIQSDQASWPTEEKINTRGYGNKFEVVFVNSKTKEKIKNDELMTLGPNSALTLKQIILSPSDLIDDIKSHGYKIRPGFFIRFPDYTTKGCISPGLISPSEDKITEAIKQIS